MVKKDDLKLLKKCRLLSSLTDEEIRQAIDKLSIRDFKKNEVVLVEADSNNFMYIILDGGVKVTRTSTEGKEIILAMHETGDFFGEMSLIDGQVTSATVTAARDSRIALISKADFYALLYNEEKILLSVLRSLCRRMRASNKIIEILNYTSAFQRIKTLFCVLANKYGTGSDGGIVLNVHIAHRDIASMTGLARETVTKIMNELRDSGHITILEDKVIRLNPRFINSEQIGKK